MNSISRYVNSFSILFSLCVEKSQRPQKNKLHIRSVQFSIFFAYLPRNFVPWKINQMPASAQRSNCIHPRMPDAYNVQSSRPRRENLQDRQIILTVSWSPAVQRFEFISLLLLILWKGEAKPRGVSLPSLAKGSIYTYSVLWCNSALVLIPISVMTSIYQQNPFV